jgi:3-hydroxyisobutyrate dehydrogenase-like beta-hydroxyacid dehydrogenase
MANVGFIGLGVMGALMARKLLARGHTLTVYARRPEAAAPLVASGARKVASPAEAASQADVIVTMVTNTQAVDDVLLGGNGVVHGARGGSIVIDHSTIAPEGARRIAETLIARGIDMLDAPVSGGAAMAESGTLSIMVGGNESVLQRCRPILECYAQTIVHIGGHGSGQIAKACNQICSVVHQLAAAEAMLLAERSGVDPVKVLEAMMGGFAASRMLEMQAPKMIRRDFDGKVQSRLHHKDIQIVLDMARGLGIELPTSRAAAEVFAKLQDRGGATADSAAVFEVLNSAAPPNSTLQPPGPES